jgi:hypothetical protein
LDAATNPRNYQCGVFDAENVFCEHVSHNRVFLCFLKMTARKGQNGHFWMSRKMSKKDPPEGNGFGASAPYKITNITI